MRAFIVAAKVEAQVSVVPARTPFRRHARTSDGSQIRCLGSLASTTELVQRSTATLFRYSVSVRLPKADSGAPAVSVDELDTGPP